MDERKRTHGKPNFKWENNTECFKKSFTTLKAYLNLFIGRVQCFELL
jgi:hypothetical protein